MQQPVLLSPKFEAESSHIFTQSPKIVTAVWGIDCLACQDEFFVNNPLDVKENYEHALGLSSPVSPSSVSVNLDSPCTAQVFFPEHLFNYFQGLRRTFLRFSQNL
jgi:hypothetical protein